MFGVSEPIDFSERTWTSLSFACSPTYRLASFTRSKAVGSPALATVAEPIEMAIVAAACAFNSFLKMFIRETIVWEFKPDNTGNAPVSSAAISLNSVARRRLFLVYAVAHGFQQRVRRKRLLQKSRFVFPEETCVFACDIRTVAAHEDDTQIWAACPN